jgi:hypothetical protein
MATVQEIFQRQVELLNLEKYHEAGYTGKDIVMLNTESPVNHGEMTNQVIKDIAPGAIILNSRISGTISEGKVVTTTVTIDGEQLDFEEAIDKYKIKIVTTSYSGNTPQARLDYFKDIQKRKGVIFFCSAGNEGSTGITGLYTRDNTAIAVGSVYIYADGTIKRIHYSGEGDELDFVTTEANGTGTSAACPNLAAQTALLLQRYCDFNQAECVEILKSLCIDLGAVGKDTSFGYGLPILPLTDKLEILEKLRGAEKMQFTDVEETRWSKAAIDRCVDEGLLVGFEDGSFRPTETVTREQFAVILTRILDKIEGRQ